MAGGACVSRGCAGAGGATGLVSPGRGIEGIEGVTSGEPRALAGRGSVGSGVWRGPEICDSSSG